MISTVIQELGREGVLPYASFFASNRPFNAPLAGLFTQYIVSCIFMLAPPPGDAYLFMISCEFLLSYILRSCSSNPSSTVTSYSLALINTLVSAGLLILYTKAYQDWDWDPPFRAPKLIIWLFFLSNVFLVVIPLIPPVSGSRAYEYLPYWVRGIISPNDQFRCQFQLHVFVAYLVSLTGVVYWYTWCIWLPKRKGYKLQRDWVLQADGVSRYVFRAVSPTGDGVDNEIFNGYLAGEALGTRNHAGR